MGSKSLPRRENRVFVVHCDLTLLALLHASDASKAGHGNIVIRTVDTDVIIICIGMTQKPHINELRIAFGAGTSLRYLAVNEIASRLGPEKARSLPYITLLLAGILFLVSLGKGRRLRGSR